MRNHLKTVAGYIAVVMAFFGLLYGAGVIHDRFADDLSDIARELREAAEQGDMKAQNDLGQVYRSGEGVTRDDEEAVKWFRLAAQQGDAEAQNNLGVMYGNGLGVTQDYEEGIKWIRKAAEHGHAGARFNLGVAYVNGKGVPQDYVRAHMWFTISAINGKESGRFNRYEVENKMTAAQIAEAEKLAREWMRKHPD